MQYLFRLTKQQFKADKLFEPNETIKIREYSFKQIVKELEKYMPLFPRPEIFIT